MNERTRLNQRLKVQGHRYLFPFPHLQTPSPWLQVWEMSSGDLWVCLGGARVGGTKQPVALFSNVPWGADIWKFIRLSCCQARLCHNGAVRGNSNITECWKETKCQKKMGKWGWETNPWRARLCKVGAIFFSFTELQKEISLLLPSMLAFPGG